MHVKMKVIYDLIKIFMLYWKYRHDDTWWIDYGNKILFRKQYANFRAVSVSLLFKIIIFEISIVIVIDNSDRAWELL